MREAGRRLFSGEAVLFPARVAASRHHGLDAARGVAAFVILFFHYRHFFVDPWAAPTRAGFASPMPGFERFAPFRDVLAPLYEAGWAAVPFFWMISGFVFCGVYVGAGTSTRQFVVNRFARLYPLHVLTLLMVAGLQCVAIARFGQGLIYPGTDAYHFTLHLFLASNWGLERGLPYTFNGPVWSVSVEVLIYALFWISRKRLVSAGAAGPIMLTIASGMIARLTGENEIALCGFYFFLGSTLCCIHAAWRTQPRLLTILALAAMLAGGEAFLTTRDVDTLFLGGIAGVFSGIILLILLAEPVLDARWRAPLARPAGVAGGQ